MQLSVLQSRMRLDLVHFVSVAEVAVSRMAFTFDGEFKHEFLVVMVFC